MTLNNRISHLSVGLVLLFISPVLQADQFSELVVFGDSNSDTGNLTGERFSNGPVWVEELATRLGLAPPGPSTTGGTNYAYGGARTGFGIDGAFGFDLPTVGWQIDDYLKNRSPDSKSLIVVYAGENDLAGFVGQRDPTVMVANISDHVSTLAAAGGKIFVVPNVPLQGYWPGFRGSADETRLNADSEEFNGLLATEIQMLSRTLDVEIHHPDFFGFVNEAIRDPSSFGLTNVVDPALQGNRLVSNANEYLFFDDFHFTTSFHSKMALQAALEIPEPSSLTLSTLALSSVLICLRSRWR